MTWWTTVLGLTPIAAWDGERVSGASLLDGVGSNNLLSTGTLLPDTYLFSGVSGNGHQLAFGTPIATPATGVIAAFFKITHSVLAYSLGTAGNTYTLYYAGNGSWYSANPSNVEHGPVAAIFGNPFFAAIIKGDSTSQLYVNGLAIGGPVSNSYIPASFDKVGENVGAYSTNLQSTDAFIAGGFWSGAATQADIQALEAAARADLATALPGARLLRYTVGRLNTAPVEALTPTGVVNRFRGQTLGARNPYFGGGGRITGTVKITPNLPTHRKVRLFNEATGILIAETWSDATTGAYSFTHIDPTQTYTVVGFDYTQAYRAVIADRVNPELMP